MKRNEISKSNTSVLERNCSSNKEGQKTTCCEKKRKYGEPHIPISEMELICVGSFVGNYYMGV